MQLLNGFLHLDLGAVEIPHCIGSLNLCHPERQVGFLWIYLVFKNTAGFIRTEISVLNPSH